jgi:hypothetical protein
MHLAVGLLDLAELFAALVLLHRIEQARDRLRSADLAQCGRCRHICLLFDEMIELVDRGLRHFVERGDAHQDFGAHLIGQQRQNARALFGLEVREHERRNLRMLAADDLRDRLRLHPLERLDALAGLTGGDTVEQQIGLLLADRLGQNAPHVVDARTTQYRPCRRPRR